MVQAGMVTVDCNTRMLPPLVCSCQDVNVALAAISSALHCFSKCKSYV